MEFIEGSHGIYNPIKVLFDTTIYERAKQCCWHIQSYKLKVAFMAELLHLQQSNRLPAELPAESMIDLMVEDSKSTLRIQLWEFEMEDFDEEVKPLLKLVWEVNSSLLKRDIEFEARRLLDTPDAMPPNFKHPRILGQARDYARILVEELHKEPVTKKLSPGEVVLELVPKVLQGFWRPKGNIQRDMPSQKLSEMAVSVTKAVLDAVSTNLPTSIGQVTFSHYVRDGMVVSIDEKVRQIYPPDVLRKKLNSFEPEVLKVIVDVAVGHICELFQPQTHTATPAEEPLTIAAIQESEPIHQVTPSSAPAAQTSSPFEDIPAVSTPPASVFEAEVMEGQNSEEPATEELPPPPADEINNPAESQTTSEDSPSVSDVDQTPLSNITLPDSPPPTDPVLEDEDTYMEPSSQTDSAVALTLFPDEDTATVLEDEREDVQSTTASVKVPKTRGQKFLRWFLKAFYCYVPPKDDD